MNPPADCPSASPLRAWLAVLSVALGSFVVVTSEFLPIGLLTHISEGLHVSHGIAGLMVTIPGLVAAIAAPVITIAAGHLDRRTIVLSLIALLVGSNALSALAPNFEIMLLSRILFGICLGGFWTIAVTLGGRLVPKCDMARATTIILAGISIATVAGVPTGTLIASLAGWRIAFAAVGGIALLIGIVQLFVLPKISPPPATGIRQLIASLECGDVRLGLATFAVVIAGHFAAYTYVTPFLKENAAASASFLSALLLAFGVTGVFGNFAGGAGAARHLRVTINCVLILLASSILLLPLAHGSPVAVALLIGLWGFAFGATPITLQLWVFKASPDSLEGGAALLVSTVQIFIALGSVLGGQIDDHLGNSAVMLCGGAAAIAGLLLVALSKHSPQTFKPDPLPDPA